MTPPFDPAPGCRWTPSRKAEVLRQLRSGEITLNEALSRYSLTLEEVDAWQMAARKAGQDGLRADNVRPPAERPKPAQGRLL